MIYKPNQEHIDMIEKVFVGILGLDEYSVFDRDSLDVHIDQLQSECFDETVYEVNFKRAYTESMGDYKYTYSVKVGPDGILGGEVLRVELLCGEDTWQTIEEHWSAEQLWVSIFCDTEEYYQRKLQRQHGSFTRAIGESAIIDESEVPEDLDTVTKEEAFYAGAGYVVAMLKEKFIHGR